MDFTEANTNTRTQKKHTYLKYIAAIMTRDLDIDAEKHCV